MLRKKVVVIGGGNGSSISIRALKEHADAFDISAIISMSDSGGSSGRLREELGVLPPGDILRAILALSRHDHGMLRQIFYERRFSSPGKLEKHNLGNLFLALAEKQTGDVAQGVRALSEALDCVGHAIPATLDKTTLCIELSNGDVVRGEANIDVPAYDRSLRIARAWLDPSGTASEEAVRAIQAADAIMLGPGDLYTSLIAALLPQGIGEAIDGSRAKIFCVVGNTYKTDGETGPVKLSEFVNELRRYLPRPIDTIICHASIDASVGRMIMDTGALLAYHVVNADMEISPGMYDPGRLGETMYQCLS